MDYGNLGDVIHFHSSLGGVGLDCIDNSERNTLATHIETFAQSGIKATTYMCVVPGNAESYQINGITGTCSNQMFECVVFVVPEAGPAAHQTKYQSIHLFLLMTVLNG